MKILDWNRIAKIFDPFNSCRHTASKAFQAFKRLFGMLQERKNMTFHCATGLVASCAVDVKKDPEMITIRFAGWISGRILSLQPDTDIQKLLSNGNRIWIRISETLLSIFLGFRLLEKLRIAQSFI